MFNYVKNSDLFDLYFLLYRSPAVSISSDASSLITAVGLANERKLSDIRGEETLSEKSVKTSSPGR